MSKIPFLACLLAFFSLPLAAEQTENTTSIPGHTIHHSVITTDSLTPEIARTYNIQRSKNRGMLNVSVIKNVPGTTGEAVPAEIKASSVNLTGQVNDLSLREIREGQAIYYIAEFGVTDQETLKFNLRVKPQGAPQSYKAQLSHQFFIK